MQNDSSSSTSDSPSGSLRRHRQSTIQAPNVILNSTENYKLANLVVPPVVPDQNVNGVQETPFSGETKKEQNGGRSSLAKSQFGGSRDYDFNRAQTIVEASDQSESETANLTPRINIIRPTSATPPASNRQVRESPQRRYSSIVRPNIDLELGTGVSTIRLDPRRASVAVSSPGKFLTPGTKDLEFASHPTPQYNRTRRISFGLGGVPKSGYWGVGRSADDGSDSDDSLLAPTSRKPSKTFNIRGPTLMGYNRRQWHYLIVFALVDFCSALVISILGVIYPREAEQKNVSATQYGFVFGIFELTILLMCPIFGKLLDRVSPQSLFNWGIFTSGICVIMFGFLAELEDTTAFITMSYILRMVEAIGDAACMTAAYAVITAECPDTVATTFIFLKTFFGIGFLLGPLIGGALYTLGGFILPFVVLGSLLFSSAIFTLFLLPKPNADLETSGETSVSVTAKGNKGTTISFLALLKSPTVVLAAFSIVSASITIGFLNVTLEPHIREFVSSATTVGVVFILSGGTYSLSSPAWSWVCHVVSDPKYVTLVGAVLTFFAFLLIGPAPFIPIDQSLWLTCLGLVIQGLGIGALFVSGFLLALRDSIDKGYPDDDSTYGLVSGLYTSVFAFGNFIGPSVAGVLVDEYGFGWASIFVLSQQVLLVFVVLCFLTFEAISSQMRAYSDFDDESYSALQVSESQEEEWVDSKDVRSSSYGAISSSAYL